MDKVDLNMKHVITLNERKNLIISGIKKIESFDNEEFLLETSLGYLIVKGESLEIIKLDTTQGIVNIKGKINGLNYIENMKNKNKEDGVIHRLFK